MASRASQGNASKVIHVTLLRSLIAVFRGLGKLGVARFAKKYPGVMETIILSIVQSVCRYYRILLESVKP